MSERPLGGEVLLNFLACLPAPFLYPHHVTPSADKGSNYQVLGLGALGAFHSPGQMPT